jgi:KDO2-lipid IV(A) lauroyltransferase
VASPSPSSPPHSPNLYRAAAFAWGERLARALPLSVLRALAGMAGLAYAWTHPRRVAVVERNLQLLDPSLGPKNARRVYAEFGRTLADYFHIGTRPAEEAERIVATTAGHDCLEEARRQGRGAIIVTAHFGLFELGALLMARAGCPCTVLTFPEPSPALSEWRAAFRKRWDADTIEIGRDSFAFLQIAERLRRGEMIATLVDRPHPNEEIRVRMPNGTALFSAGILLLAAHCGCPVIPAMIARRKDGSYHSQVGPSIQVRERATRAETLQFYSQQIADIFLPALCAHPEQWYQFVPLSPAS